MDGGGLGQFGLISQHRPSHIRPEAFTTDAGRLFNQRALVGGYLPLAVAPETHRLWRDLQHFGQLGNAASLGDGFCNWVHASNSTRVERHFLHL